MSDKPDINNPDYGDDTYALKALGWSRFFQDAWKIYEGNDYIPGRIAIENRDNYQILTAQGEMDGEVTGKFLFGSDEKGRFPKVGDWVVLTVIPAERKALIHEILPRRTFISRKVAGTKYEEQVMATNLDFLFIVHGMDHNINYRKIERYIAMALTGGCNPVIILNKADLIDINDYDLQEITERMGGHPVIFTSIKQDIGLNALDIMLKEGETFAFVGPSGVGKSSLINSLTGRNIQDTGEVRQKDRKGRHVTTRREMILMPERGILIDTPGIRELYLWESEEGLEDTFQDIYDLEQHCFFSDCRHQTEKGCAVLAAVAEGTISQERHQNYLKLQKEQEYLEQKQNQQLYSNRKRKWKEISKAIKTYYKIRPKRRER